MHSPYFSATDGENGQMGGSRFVFENSRSDEDQAICIHGSRHEVFAYPYLVRVRRIRRVRTRSRYARQGCGEGYHLRAQKHAPQYVPCSDRSRYG